MSNPNIAAIVQNAIVMYYTVKRKKYISYNYISYYIKQNHQKI